MGVRPAQWLAERKQEEIMKRQAAMALEIFEGPALSGTSVPENNNEKPSERRGVSVNIEQDALWKRADSKFFWNEWVSQPLIDIGVCVLVSLSLLFSSWEF